MKREQNTEKKPYVQPNMVDLGSAVANTLGLPIGRNQEFSGWVNWHFAS